MIGACDICDAQNVPIMKGVTFGCEIASCYPCQGQPIPEDETMTTEIDRYRELLRRTDIVLSMLLLEIADKDMAKEARALLSAIDVETHTGASPEMTPLNHKRQKGLNMGMTFGQFSEANRARCESSQGFNHPLSGWSTSDWMTAMVGEVGEAANVVKKLNRYRDGVPGNKVSEAELRDQLRKELGDVFVYLDLMAQSLGFSIADAAAEVFNSKSSEIGYPGKL